MASNTAKASATRNDSIKPIFMGFLPYIVLVIGIVITGSIYCEALHNARENLRYRFDREADKVFRSIDHRFTTCHQVILSTQALMNTSATVSRHQFAQFINMQRLKQLNPEIEFVSYSQMIPQAQLNQHIQMMKQQGFPNYTVKPSGVRDPYTSNIFVEPFSGSGLAAFGYDFFTDPSCRLAMQLACDDNEAVITEDVDFIKAITYEDQSSFVFILPVYRHSVKTGSIQARRNALAGWIMATCRMNSFMNSAIAISAVDSAKDMRIRVYDGKSHADSDLMYDSKGNLTKARPGCMHYNKTLDMYHHAWTLCIEALPQFEIDHLSGRYRTILPIGLIITLLLAYVVYALVNSERMLKIAVSQKTSELETNQLLLHKSHEQLALAIEGSGVGLWDWYQVTGEYNVNERWAELIGYTIEELQPISIKTLYQYTHPDDIDQAETAFKEYITGGKSRYECEIRMRHKDGRWIWILTKGRISLCNVDGIPVRITGTHMDITRTRTQQESLQRQEAILNGTTSALNQLLTSSDFESAILEALSLLGAAINVNRICIFQNQISEDNGEISLNTQCKWYLDPAMAHEDSVELQNSINTTYLPRWLSELEANRMVQGPVWTLPDDEKSIFEAQSIRSLVAAPIFVSGKLWGFIRLDDFTRDRMWSASEMGILALATSGIGGAIKQHDLSTDLAESRQWLKTTLDFLATGVVIIDRNKHIIVDANPSFIKIVGLPLDDVVGSPCHRFVARKDHACPCLVSDKSLIDDECELIKSDGTRVPILMTVVVTNRGGRDYLVHGITDISSLKETERKLRESMALFNGLFQSMQDIVFFKDLAGHYHTYNQRFYQLLPSSIEDSKELVVQDVFDKEAASIREESDRRVIADQKTIISEDNITLQNGQEIILETRKSPVITDDGQCIGLVGVARDITEKRLAEQAMMEGAQKLEDANAQLKKVVKAREDMAHFIVHDMRSPLTSILGGIDISKDETSSPEIRKRFLGMATASAVELNEMVSSLLDVYKMDDNKMVLNRTDDDILHAAYNAVNSVRIIAQQRQQQISVEGQSQILSFDFELIRRVIVNILVNAMKHSDNGGNVIVSVSEMGLWTRITVTDNGPGIPAEYKDTIFDKFVQVVDGKKNKKYSTGLGLTFCRMVVELHNGHIGVDSELGKGSTFWFELPLNATS
ncbi:MAG: CHASE domain-containing protein [Armatimonadota bacterium]